MTFGEISIDQAQDTILAHSLKAGEARLRKGRKLTSDDVDLLRAAGVQTVWAARLSGDDVHEDEAANALAAAMVAPGISARAPFTGRANLQADARGLVSVDAGLIAALNQIDEGITLASLPNLAQITARSLVATIKIIPYAVPRAALDQALALLQRPVFQLHPFSVKQADLIVTETPGTKPALTQKGIDAVRARLDSLGVELAQIATVAHEPVAIKDALATCQTRLTLILGASATSDRGDVCPAAVTKAGGEITRFGMPVDPGNLLFLGKLDTRRVIGLPGCVRSPALNGADWVLQRCIAGLDVTSADIAAMGVGGLLKEISTRPQPRQGNARAPERPKVRIMLLAGGKSSRMGGQDKLMRTIDGVPLIARAASAAVGSQADGVHVVLGQDFAAAREDALRGLDLETHIAQEAREGMGGSIRAGLGIIPNDTDAVILALADMPDITSDHFNQLIKGFAPTKGHSIARAVTATGKPGHPVLFGRRFFEALSNLSGDEGARGILKQARDYIVDIPTRGDSALIDLDTPEDWENWEKSR